MEQLSLFQASYPDYKINKPIRLIECFAGIGSQSKALEVLDADFEHYKLVEWAVPSIKAYNSIHIKDFTDHSANLTKDQLIEKVRGISVDYNQPLTDEKLNKKSIEWLKEVYNNMVAANDLCPDISRVKGENLEIENEQDRKHTYILTYSFPCQDLSLAGTRAGYKKGSNTRSGLLWEVERILYELKDKHQRPDVLIMENVQGVLTDIESWNSWLNSLTALGYTNYYKKINAKNYGIPQNRLRVFMVSILGEYSYIFPSPVKLKYRLKDFLDKGEVDEKYYLSEKMINYIKADNEKWTGNNGNSLINKDTASTLNTGEGSKRCDASNYICDDLPENTDLKRLGGLWDKEGKRHQAGSIYDSNGVSPTLDCSSGGYTQPMILERVINVGNAGNGHHSKDISSADGIMPTLTTGNHNNGQLIAIKNATKQGYLFAEEGDGIDISSRMESHRGTVQKDSCQTLTTEGGNNVGVVVKDTYIGKKIKNIVNKKGGRNMENNLRIRKLTPPECMRLMSFEKKDTEPMRQIGMSDGQIYHCAGDSIVSTCLIGIFGEMLGVDTTKVIEDYAERLANE